jgi:hypothetical protein
LLAGCLNKSVPIYILPRRAEARCSFGSLCAALHNYVYRAWFQPYKSEIDWGQFLAQVIGIHETPPLLPAETPANVARFAATMSRAICARVEAVQQKIGDRTDEEIILGGMVGLQQELGFESWEPIFSQKFRSLQPLFRAVAIVINLGDYRIAIPDIAEIPVLVVVTGIEEGLSAPITLESITHDDTHKHHRVDDSIQVVETSLATAVRFVMDLEKCEVAAFGPKPDPGQASKEPRRSCLLGEYEALVLAQRYGWEEEEAPKGPSSSWVDTNIYREWTGAGANFDANTALCWERKCRTRVEEELSKS